MELVELLEAEATRGERGVPVEPDTPSQESELQAWGTGP